MQCVLSSYLFNRGPGLPVGLLPVVPVPVTLCLPQRCCSLLQVLPLLLPPRLLIDTTATIAHCIPYLTLTLLLSTINKHCEQCSPFQTPRENIMPCPPSETDEQKELSKAVPAPLDNPAHSTSDLLGTITSTPEEEDARRAANKERYDVMLHAQDMFPKSGYNVWITTCVHVQICWHAGFLPSLCWPREKCRGV